MRHGHFDEAGEVDGVAEVASECKLNKVYIGKDVQINKTLLSFYCLFCTNKITQIIVSEHFACVFLTYQILNRHKNALFYQF